MKSLRDKVFGETKSPRLVVEARTPQKNDAEIVKGFDCSELLMSKLLSMYSNFDERNFLIGARIVIFGFDELSGKEIFKTLRSAGAHVFCERGDVSEIHNMAKRADLFSHVIVNLDAIEDLGSTISSLLIFRSTWHGVITVLITESVRADDLGSERIDLCDATLRGPVSEKRLIDGLVAAAKNHI